jgi:hypothetical protein
MQFGLGRNMKNDDRLWLTNEGGRRMARIKDYTAFSRAIDGAGNVEKEFNERRNANTFEVKRRRRR